MFSYTKPYGYQDLLDDLEEAKAAFENLKFDEDPVQVRNFDAEDVIQPIKTAVITRQSSTVKQPKIRRSYDA